MKLNKFLVVLLAINSLLAQQNTTAKIETVTESGLHKIMLAPEIRSFSNEDLSDFRILDAKSKQVPYFILRGDNEVNFSSFLECKIISKTAVPKSKTTLIFENPKTSIDEIVLSVANSDVTKRYSISGSNDQKEWFGLINNSLLTQLENSEDTSVFKTISLPLTSYRYLKIDFNDKKTLPINVLKIGYISNKTSYPKLEEIFPKSSKITQFSAPKITQIHISFQNRQMVNHLIFEIKNPSLFKRKARIYVLKSHQVKHKTQNYQETSYEFELNSNSKNAINMPQLFEKEFFIEIENQDNPPLTLAKIQFFQNQVGVIADLKANEKYTIQTGNSNLNAPNYDLENFKSKMENNLPETKIYDIKHVVSQKINSQNKSFWQQSWFMWLCIGLGGIAILYFTSSLVKDVNNKS
jgi:hypothetical protein